jgi:hypothetical protein
MPEFNLSQAARLYGKSRMTLHRHCDAGRLSSRLSDDGQRLIDLSELIRAYGEPPNHKTPKTPFKPPRRYTQHERDTLLLNELQALREQVTALQQEVSELRRLPAPEHPSEPSPNPQEANTPLTGFDDLLKRFESRR